MRKVALLIETDRAYGRGLLKGIARYLHEHELWNLYVEPGSLKQSVPRLAEWGCQGIIIRNETARLQRAVESLGLPAVVLGYQAEPGQIRLGTFSQQEGRLAAEYFLDRGFRHFAFCGHSEQYSMEREKGFERKLGEAGLSVHVYRRPRVKRDRWWAREQEHVARWISELPQPLAVFACDDELGRRVIESCLDAELAVPDDVALLGVDNDELLCDLCHPTLSSIALGTEKAGYEAAAALDQMMAGHAPKQDEIIVEPLAVITRQSTDVFAMEDREVAQAVAFIRQHASEPITVDDVLERVPMARRSLEYRFRRAIGRTPHAEILRVRLERAKTLLATTDRSMPEIAEASGFATADYMGYAFRRALGMKPLAYRSSHRGY